MAGRPNRSARPGGKAGAPARARKKRRMQDAPRVRGPRIKIEEIDYKDVPLLQRLVSAQGKLFSRKRSGLDAAGQRKVCLALKRARHLGLMPFVS